MDQVWGKNQPHPYHVMQNVEEPVGQETEILPQGGEMNALEWTSTCTVGCHLPVMSLVEKA